MVEDKLTISSACRCCMGETSYFSTSMILNFLAIYSICSLCSSVQVESPVWIEQAHSKAISNLDTGLVSRCISASRLISTLLFLEGEKKSIGIDWGGGTGLLTRLLRDQGYRMLSYDKYAVAEHAEGFVATLEDAEKSATFMVSIECFEHLINPISAFKDVTSNKSYFIFTTDMIDTPPPDPAEKSWWYYIPESGQHITFASKKGLTEFSKILGFEHYVCFGSLHVMSRKKLRIQTKLFLNIRAMRGVLIIVIPEVLNRLFSLTQADKEKLLSEGS